MTGELITELTRIGGLRVIAQTSSMQYKDSPKSIPEIARELNVEYVTEASIVKVGDLVRLSVKLVNANANENVWAENFQKPFEDIFDLQSDFALAIAKEIRIELAPGETRRLADAGKVDPQVYEAYLKGRFFLNKRTPDGITKASVTG